MKKVRRFNGEDGSMVSGLYGDEANERFAKLMNDAKAEEAPAEAEPAPENTRVQPNFDRFSGPAAKPQNFKSAFADARSAGDKTFEFGGKKYTTELAKPSAPSTPSVAPKAETKKADTPVERGLPAKSSKEQSLAVAQIPLDDKRTPVKGESASGSELGRNVSNTLSALPISRGIQAVQSGAKLAGRKGVEEFVKKDPIFRNKELEIIKEVPRLLEGPKKQLALPKPTPRLEYDKAGAKAAGRNDRAMEQRAEMLKENARRSGLRGDASAETLKAVRDKLGGKDFKLMKKGGSVKGYASGGSVSSASKRADGCAIRGKTRA